jgi:hypothetical protein
MFEGHKKQGKAKINETESNKKIKDEKKETEGHKGRTAREKKDK